ELTEYPLHYQHDVELVVVLQGEIQLKNGSGTYLLPRGSVFVTNAREVHGLYKTEGSNTVALIHLNTAYFSNKFPLLSKSAFRTYTENEADQRFTRLRESVLGILSLYLRRGINYKQNCIDETMELLDFLNKNFNLCAVDESGLSVSPQHENLLILERMSRIIPYIYEHHAEKISLDDLAEEEHLSTFYLSHMIKTCTGLNFRDFLCYARVEFSEMYLLGTDMKINAIAKQVGFSTTAYYEKFFERWYHRTPTEHRKEFIHMVKGPQRTEQLKPISINTALSMVQQELSASHQKTYGLPVKQLKLYTKMNAMERPLAKLEQSLEIEVTLTDFQRLGYGLYTELKRFSCKLVNLKYTEEEADTPKLLRLKEQLEDNGFTVNMRRAYSGETAGGRSYGLDSIANLIYIFQRNVLSPHPMSVKLMDSGAEDIQLKGDNGLMTSSGIYKPAYYAYLILLKMQGDLISYEKNYAAVRIGKENPSYIVTALNYDNSTLRLCTGKSSMHDTRDRLKSFKDELEVNVNLNNISGRYSIKKYSFTNPDTIFDFMARLDFPKTYSSAIDFDLNYYSIPKTDIYTDDIDGTLHLNFQVEGAGLQMAIIEPIEVGQPDA
ncbi:MAG: helix-turn-helix domain-containing protein, partial [Eubacterium sp.]|nr:helix-turn-helix domain-containing protein [Candidatus Colimonas fimequi]